MGPVVETLATEGQSLSQWVQEQIQPVFLLLTLNLLLLATAIRQCLSMWRTPRRGSYCLMGIRLLERPLGTRLGKWLFIPPDSLSMSHIRPTTTCGPTLFP